MSSVAAAFAITHTPGLGNRWNEPPADQAARMREGFASLKRELASTRIDLIVAFINDHFDMYTLGNMPAFSIATAPEHFGPPADSEQWLEMKRRAFCGDYDYAMGLYRDLLDSGFDIARSGSAEFVHNMLIPLRFVLPDLDTPIVPIFINCFAPPLPRIDRAHALGRAVRAAVDRRDRRVCFVASGGLAHWPPYPREGVPLKDELDHLMWKVFNHGSQIRKEFPQIRGLVHKREMEMAAEREDLVNEKWDRAILRLFERGDSVALNAMTHDQIEPVAGSGGSELLMWAALMGAMRDAPGRTRLYEPVRPWMGGVALLDYAVSTSSPAPGAPAPAAGA